MTDLARILSASRLFAGVDPALIRSLEPEAHLRHYREEDVIWAAGEKADSFTIIRSGLVQIVRRFPSGEASLVGVFGPHESIGDPAVLDRTTYPADAVALSEEVDVVRVRAAVFLEAMKTDVAVAKAINQALLDHTRVLWGKIDVMSAGSVPQRLAALFDHLAERFGDDQEDGTISIPVALSRTALAWLVCARVETVIRTMTRWQKDGLIETSKGGFTLHGSPSGWQVSRAPD
ncbi:MAG: Crp/Fnr family transcriptional regulator [Myxococcota bacterium]